MPKVCPILCRRWSLRTGLSGGIARIHHGSDLVGELVLVWLHALDVSVSHRRSDCEDVARLSQGDGPKCVSAQVRNELRVQPPADAGLLEAVCDRRHIALATAGTGREHPPWPL